MAGILRKYDLAIIIPVVDCFFYTHQLISSLNVGMPHGLILIDNGSGEEIKKYFSDLESHGTAKLITNKENIGVSKSWNIGIKKAIEMFDSRYFCLLNNDILLHPKAIRCMVRLLKSGKMALVSGTDIAGKLNEAYQIFNREIPKEEELTEAPEFSCFMLSRETIETLKIKEHSPEPKPGWFDENFFPAYFEDNDYHRRLNRIGLKALKTNQALYFHYGSRTIKSSNELKEISNLGYVANLEYYKRKWGGKPGEEYYFIPFAGKT